MSTAKTNPPTPRKTAGNMPAAETGTAGGRQPTLLAGVGKADITDYEAGPVNDPLYTKVLVLRDENSTFVIATLDAVAVAEIGRIGNAYMDALRSRLETEFQIPPGQVIVNASHCHGTVCDHVDERTAQAVGEALANLVPVEVGVGRGHEDRIMENRRVSLRDGREADCRRAYSLPPDGDVTAIGPVDPEIGVLRFDRTTGGTLAVVYNFACHPIQGVPDGGNTADITGIASQVIEEGLEPGAMALFLQGCGADVNPARYKDVHSPRDATPLGHMLGLSALEAVKQVQCHPVQAIQWSREHVDLPRADLTGHIERLQAEQDRLLQSLRPTDINLKTFLQLTVVRSLSPEYPSYYSHRYLHERAMGRADLSHLDASNQRDEETYRANIHVMEALTRLQVNLNLLRMHQRKNHASGKDSVCIEMIAVRIGEWVLLTFPGELTVPIGLRLKQRSPHAFTYVAACTNGYIYYAPTAEQLRNRGYAQEDSDCFLAPEWQALFETKADDMLGGL